MFFSDELGVMSDEFLEGNVGCSYTLTPFFPPFYSAFLEAIFEVAWFCGMGMIAAPFEYPGILVFCGGLQGEDNKNGQQQLFMPACILLANYGRKNEKSL